MRSQAYDAGVLRGLLRGQKIATMPELKTVLGTNVDVTVFRKLRELGYRSSYTHRGKYYALEEVAAFDDRGLWSFGDVGFSRFGSLVETAESFVVESQSGYFARELTDVLGTEVRGTLLGLFKQDRIDRQELSGRHLYIAADPSVGKRQLHARRLRNADGPVSVSTGSVSEEVKAAIVLFFSLLDEKLRRLYAGLESLKLGHGGDRIVAGLLGLDVHTIASGRRELLENDIVAGQARREGGGRKPVKKKRQT